MARRTTSNTVAQLPPWASALPPAVRTRPRDGGLVVRHQRQCLLARPIEAADLLLRAAATSAFAEPVGVLPAGDGYVLLEAPPRGRRLDRAGGESRYRQLALLAWQLHAAGYTPGDVELQRIMADDTGLKLLSLPGRGDETRAAMALAMSRTFLTGRRSTAGMRADKLAPLVMRLLGGETAAAPMLRARLAQLPDIESWRAFVRAQLAAASTGELPRVIPVLDVQQGLALRALLLEAAMESGMAAGDGPLFAGRLGVRLIGPLDLSACARRLSRLSPAPTVALVLGSRPDIARELEHAAELAPPPTATARGMFEWLRPLGVETSLAVEHLVPALLADPGQARRMISALIERAGAVIEADEPRIVPDWFESWQSARGRRNSLSVLQPDAARVAALLALSTGGLDAAALAESRELSRGAALLEEVGIARRDGTCLLLAEGAASQVGFTSPRAALLLWLSEREYLCPFADPTRRAAWRVGLRLRAGDLSCWHDDDAGVTLKQLADAHLFDDAMLLLEAHAIGAAKSGAGPPDVDALYLGFDIGRAVWPLKRLRRLLRLWTRGYSGEMRALALALCGRIERSLGGSDYYGPRIEEAERLCEDLPRFAREQTLLECASALCMDDPARALELVERIGRQPARAAKYLCHARMHLVRAECEFVSIKPNESVAHTQEARDALTPTAPWTRRARIEAEIEARYVAAHGMIGWYRDDVGPLLQPMRELQQESGIVSDVLGGAIVNDRLMRMRMSEVGTMTPGQIDGVLAEARSDNLRGYLIVVFQLEENALYRGDIGIARQLNARMDALNGDGERNRFVMASTRRHQALLQAVNGNAARARKLWHEGADWMIAEPWRSRTRLLRHGEWGLLLMLCGRFDAARRPFQRAYDGMAAMGAGGRGAHFLLYRMLGDLLCGRELSPEDRANFEQMQSHGYGLAQALKPVFESNSGALPWTEVPSRIDDAEAPDFWKAIASVAAVALAVRARDAAVVMLGRAALERVTTDWPILQRWLRTLLPEAEVAAEQLPPRALQAIFEMKLDALAIKQALINATGAAQVGVQIGLDEAGREGSRDAALSDALDRAMLGETVRDGGCCATGLRAPFGAIAVKAGPDQLPVLHAIARRLTELHELADARRHREAERRTGRNAVRAAWAMATGDASLGGQLNALRALVQAETGADAVTLELLRGGQVLMSAGDAVSARHEATADVDHALRLRARAVGGNAAALDEAAQRAARAVAACLQRAPERLRRELFRPRDDEQLFVDGEHIGNGKMASRLLTDLRRFADLDLPVEVVGEPGCGKDLMARGLHGMSGRAALPLVVVDCATLRRETAASELFGHVRGAFTGATHDHIGMLERAAEGTLQMDGLDELDVSIQAMLLRAFQARTFLPVGGIREREFKARIVITSERPLRELAAEGRVRDDLAQRLQGLTLRVPPLRERGEDALLIARDFLAVQGRQLNRRLRFARSAEKFILDHNWPGNVRELRAAVTRAAVMADTEEVGVADLQAADVGGVEGSLLLPMDAPGLVTSQRLVLGALRGVGEAPPNMLVRRLRLSRTTVSTSLAELTRRGLCERIGNGRTTRYRAT